MDARLLQPEFWRDLRKSSIVSSHANQGVCCFWCIEADSDLRKYDPSHAFKTYEVRSVENPWIAEKHGIFFHQWLEYRGDEGRFIADGTAGQIVPQLTEGFYGLTRDAPEELRNLYCGIVLPVNYSIYHSQSESMLSRVQ